jgi:hypothetical protein
MNTYKQLHRLQVGWNGDADRQTDTALRWLGAKPGGNRAMQEGPFHIPCMWVMVHKERPMVTNRGISKKKWEKTFKNLNYKINVKESNKSKAQ